MQTIGSCLPVEFSESIYGSSRGHDIVASLGEANRGRPANSARTARNENRADARDQISSSLAVKCRKIGASYVIRIPRSLLRFSKILMMDSATYVMCAVV